MDEETYNKVVFIGGIALAMLILFSVVTYFWLGPMIFTEQREAGAETVEQTMDADNAIQEYEWFRQQYQDIEAQRNQIDNSYEELDRFYDTYGKDPSDWSRTTKERHNRIQQRITGNQNMLDQMVADYNARSQQANNAIFKCHLPYQVDEQLYITGPPGSDGPEQAQDVDVDGERIDQEPAPAEECDELPSEIEN